MLVKLLVVLNAAQREFPPKNSQFAHYGAKTAFRKNLLTHDLTPRLGLKMGIAVLFHEGSTLLVVGNF